MDADDRQPVLAVLGVPCLQVGQGTDAVDAAVGPEVDEHDPAAQARQGQRLVPGGVEPLLVADEFRRLAEHRQAGFHGFAAAPARRARRPRPDAVGRLTANVSERRLRRGGVLQAFGRVDEEAGQIGGDLVLELDVVVAEHRQRDDDHHRPHRDLQDGPAPGKRRDHLAAAEHEEVEDDGGTESVGEGDGEATGIEGRRGGDDDHAGEDRSRAGGVEDAEAGPDRGARPEAVALGMGDAGAARELTDPGLEAGRQGRDHQHDPEGKQDEDRELAEEVVRQAEGGDHIDQSHRREGEGDRQADDDAERPPVAAGGAGGERNGQDRQHTGRERRRGAGDESEEDQQCHPLNLSSKGLRGDDGFGSGAGGNLSRRGARR